MKIKRNIKIISIILALIIVAIFAIQNVYAINENQNSFLSVSSNTVIPGESVDITLDLGKISYLKYSVKITSNIQTENLEIIDEKTGETLNNISEENNNSSELHSNTESSDNNIVQNDNGKEFTISNISNLENLIIRYKVPENTAVGTTITLNIVVREILEDSKNDNNTNTVTNETLADVNITSNEVTNSTIAGGNNENESTNVTEQKANTMENQIILKVVEKIVNDNSNNSNNNNSSSNNNGGSEPENNKPSGTTSTTSSASDKKTQTTMSSSIQSSGTQSSGSQTLSSGMATQTVTYNGSNDNYLTNLLVDGTSVSDNFNKTNTTYFKTVESGTTSVDIGYTTSDSSSTVCIYGNTGLQEGTNKILVTVTAENGNVRNYRIYVTVK